VDDPIIRTLRYIPRERDGLRRPKGHPLAVMKDFEWLADGQLVCRPTRNDVHPQTSTPIHQSEAEPGERFGETRGERECLAVIA
jgi:hypothetical protein